MIVSLNELAATSAKAVRGCGHPEGIAEEMGFAVRWLCERDLPGVATLLSALDRGSPHVEAPVVERGGGGSTVRAADGGAIPALQLAPSLVELAIVESAGGSSLPVRVDTLTPPLLLVPFVARRGAAPMTARWTTGHGSVLIEGMGAGVRIRADDESALVAPEGRDVRVGRPVIDSGPVPPVLLTAAQLEAAARRSVDGGHPVADADWDRLTELARRTHVPVNEESRLRGAGAGLTDND